MSDPSERTVRPILERAHSCHGPRDDAFTGRVPWVHVDIDAAEDGDHLITPEERLRVAVARRGGRGSAP